jgi:protein PhnA
MTSQTHCSKCGSENIYQDRDLWTCPDCTHEWTANDIESSPKVDSGIVVARDANGNPLVDGDSVTVVKDLKVKGASSPLKVGTKVKSIRIVDGPDGHNVSCKIDGFGFMHLKSEYLKKS